MFMFFQESVDVISDEKESRTHSILKKKTKDKTAESNIGQRRYSNHNLHS